MTAAALAASLFAGAVIGGLSPADAGKPRGANKASASGSSTEIAGAHEEIVILSETVKTSKTQDLLFGVSLECAITTALETIGNDEAQASGSIKVWIEIDGQKIGIAEDDTDRADNVKGEVTFCDRTYRRTTSLFEDEEATIKTFLDTKSAHSFNWVALDMGSGIHTIEVVAKLDQATSGGQTDTTARIAIGKRTLTIEPVHSANNEAITELG